MKPTHRPTVRQILTLDHSLRRFGIYSLIFVITSLCFVIYGLLSNSSGYAWFGLLILVVLLGFVARILWRIRFILKTYENGETVRATLTSVEKNPDQINVDGKFIFNNEKYEFSEDLSRTTNTIKLAVGHQIWLVVDRDNPENVYFQDLFTPEHPEEIRQPFAPDATRLWQQIVLPKSVEGWDGRHPRKILWAYESNDNVIENEKENPGELDIVKLIEDVYALEAHYGILEINKEKNLFMQIGIGGAPIEFCAGSDGPIYGVDAVPSEIAIKCFLSYCAGDEFWKTAVPWEVHIKSIKDSKGKK